MLALNDRKWGVSRPAARAPTRRARQRVGFVATVRKQGLSPGHHLRRPNSSIHAMPFALPRAEQAFDQNTSFADRALSGSFRKKQPFARRDPVWE